MEVQDYVKDLHDWEERVKTKDRELIQHSGAGGSASNENCPPVRGATSFTPQESPESLASPSLKLSNTPSETVSSLVLANLTCPHCPGPRLCSLLITLSKPMVLVFMSSKKS